MIGIRLRLGVLAACIVAALGVTGAASATGYFKTAQKTSYTSFLHFRATYAVYDGRFYCDKDEYGFYNDFDCMDYDDDRAQVDFRVMRMGPRPRIIYSDRLYGSRGRVSTDFYSWELPDMSWRCPGPDIHYRAIFRLRDPITDRIVDTRTMKFRQFCR